MFLPLSKSQPHDSCTSLETLTDAAPYPGYMGSFPFNALLHDASGHRQLGHLHTPSGQGTQLTTLPQNQVQTDEQHLKKNSKLSTTMKSRLCSPVVVVGKKKKKHDLSKKCPKGSHDFVPPLSGHAPSPTKWPPPLPGASSKLRFQ